MLVPTRDKMQHRAEMTLALFHQRIYKKVLVLVPNLEIQEVVFDALAFMCKHTKVEAQKRDMRLILPASVKTKLDSFLYIATPQFERLRGREWDLLVEYGDMVLSGSTESLTALYASVRVGDDPLVIKWRD